MKKILRLRAIRGEVLGLTVYRGFGHLSDLARISKPDIYDQSKNPTGTQRDLNRKHARDAYNYVKTSRLAFYPEIVLNLRHDNGVQFKSACKGNDDLGYLLVDIDKVRSLKSISISRLDGNHRLFFADGHDETMPPLDREASFCLIYGLKKQGRDAELLLFRDINANQVGMNTSHLDSITLRTATEDLRVREPNLYIAERLMEDRDSPFFGRVYRGGVRPGGALLPLRTLKTSVEYMRARSKKIDLLEVDAQAALVKNYWKAVKLWVPEAWEQPKAYIALRATGFWAISFVGSEVVDRAVSSGRVEPQEMLRILRSGQKWDWSNSGDFRGYGGRAGAVEIAKRVVTQFATEGKSVRDIEEKLRANARGSSRSAKR